MAAQAGIQLNSPRRRAGVAWALLVIAHLLGAPLACVWHCQGGGAMAGMSHGAHQHAATRQGRGAMPAGHASHQGHGAAPADQAASQAPAAMIAASQRRVAAPAESQAAFAMPCAPHGAGGETHPTAIFPATLALTPVPALARRPTPLAGWASPAQPRPRRPVIPPPRS